MNVWMIVQEQPADFNGDCWLEELVACDDCGDVLLFRTLNEADAWRTEQDVAGTIVEVPISE